MTTGKKIWNVGLLTIAMIGAVSAFAVSGALANNPRIANGPDFLKEVAPRYDAEVLFQPVPTCSTDSTHNGISYEIATWSVLESKWQSETSMVWRDHAGNVGGWSRDQSVSVSWTTLGGSVMATNPNNGHQGDVPFTKCGPWRSCTLTVYLMRYNGVEYEDFFDPPRNSDCLPSST